MMTSQQEKADLEKGNDKDVEIAASSPKRTKVSSRTMLKEKREQMPWAWLTSHLYLYYLAIHCFSGFLCGSRRPYFRIWYRWSWRHVPDGRFQRTLWVGMRSWSRPKLHARIGSHHWPWQGSHQWVVWNWCGHWCHDQSSCCWEIRPSHLPYFRYSCLHFWSCISDVVSRNVGHVDRSHL